MHANKKVAFLGRHFFTCDAWEVENHQQTLEFDHNYQPFRRFLPYIDKSKYHNNFWI